MTTLTDAQQDAWSAVCQHHYTGGGYMQVALLMFGQYVLCDVLTLQQAINWKPRNIYTEGLRHVYAHEQAEMW